ncbi:hypothetical protein ACVWWO_003673 [Bradyrhizobium sp. F1.13.1]
MTPRASPSRTQKKTMLMNCAPDSAAKMFDGTMPCRNAMIGPPDTTAGSLASCWPSAAAAPSPKLSPGLRPMHTSTADALGISSSSK